MFTTKTITATDICAALRIHHKDHIWFEELRLSSGFAWQGRIDFMAVDPAPSTGNIATAYEVKVSKSDYKKDTYEKQRGARLYSDRFYYIAPDGIIAPDTVPDWAGLITVTWKVSTYNNTPRIMLKEVITAPKRDKEPPSWGLVCSLIRNAKKYGGNT